MNNEINWILLGILFVLAVYAFSVKHRVLKGKEIIAVGIALGFAATSWTFLAVLRTVTDTFNGSAVKRLSISAAMTAPLVVALAFGIRALYRYSLAAEVTKKSALSENPPLKRRPQTAKRANRRARAKKSR